MTTHHYFGLPESLSAKSEPSLIADDQSHFARVASAVEDRVAELSARLAAERRNPAGGGQRALDRDLQVHRLSAQLHTLRRYGLDLCLGRILPTGAGEPLYIGRLGLTDKEGHRLLHDWRSPAAAPFFGATHADPMGVSSRRRYRWSRGQVVDYWDEVFSTEALRLPVAHDDESAFIASLGASRSARMRDVLGTIAADQDAVIRAPSRQSLVVDGGPGTGKTVVALHRAAYLLYFDPRLSRQQGGLLFIGPHEPYLAYVEDVLPSLGEEGVLTCTLADLVPEGASAGPEPVGHVAALKADARWTAAIDRAVAIYEEPPTEALPIDTEWGEVVIDAAAWAAAFEAVEPGTPHNDAREQIWEGVGEVVREALGTDDEVSIDELVRSLRSDDDLADAVHRAWPLLEPSELVGDLWTVRAYLRHCAPWLTPAELAVLLRPSAPTHWTTADLPLLDAARHRLGDPAAARQRRRRAAAAAAERERLEQVIDDLIAAEDDMSGLMTQLVHGDLRDALVDENSLPRADSALLAGPFLHVVVDEAQELTDAQWQMVLRRCPSRSLTIVGDRAQARHGFVGTWQERLERVGLDRVTQSSLTVNYRTPSEVMAEAEKVIRAAVPDAEVPRSIRSSGVPVVHGSRADLDTILDTWLTEYDEGVACVIGDPAFVERPRVRSLTPELVKGLEFDLVVLVDTEDFGESTSGAVDRYVAMTRATQRLVILTSR